MLKKIMAMVVISVVSAQTPAMTMQQLFDSVNAQANVNSPAVLQGQTLNLYSGGSLFMRMPKRTYNLASITPPSWGAGCGGIDLFLGAFGFINKEQFVAMLRNIGSNALGYGFKLAVQNLCPTCDNVMQALQATAQAANRLNVDTCEAAKGIVNAVLPDTWTRGRQNAAKNFGVDGNMFENLTDAWTNVMNNEGRANQVVNDVAQSKPEVKDHLPTGNIVWKALKKMHGIDDEYRMVLMSMTGTTIFMTEAKDNSLPIVLPAKDISIQQLVGTDNSSGQFQVPIWRCDKTAEDGCLQPYEGYITTKSFREMVRIKMTMISDQIAARRNHANVAETIAFLQVTDLPVYKMLAVSTSLDNTGLADVLINRYQDLIAAKYAEVYILAAVRDLNAALTKYASSSAEPAIGEHMKELQPKLDQLTASARQVLSTAYTQTISTFNIAQEVRHMERTMNANLSETLKNSLAFAKSLR